MRVIKKALFFSLGLLVFLVATRRFYRVMMLQSQRFLSNFSTEQADAHNDSTEQDGGIRYNFNRLVRLMESCAQMKRTFYQNFTPYFAHKQEIDLDELKDLLKQLHYEKVRFQHYTWEVKGYVRGSVPLRQQRAFKYYSQP